MGLEDFIGLEQNGAMDAAAFERFQERVKAAAAHIQAIRKEEKKRKKKEDELIKILLKFIKSSDKKDLVLLISRVLERNVPANFILAIILLGNEEIQREIGEYLSLKSGQQAPEQVATEAQVTGAQTVAQSGQAPKVSSPELAAQEPNASQEPESARADVYSNGSSAHEAANPEDRSLVFFQTDQTMPLKIRIEIDKWIRDLIFQASETPQKLLATAYETDQQAEEAILVLNKPLVRLVAHIIFSFLEQNGLEEDIVKMKEFAEFLLNGILNRTKEDLGQRKELE